MTPSSGEAGHVVGGIVDNMHIRSRNHVVWPYVPEGVLGTVQTSRQACSASGVTTLQRLLDFQ